MIWESIIKPTVAFFFSCVSSLQYCDDVSWSNSFKDLKVQCSKEKALLGYLPLVLVFVENEILNDNRSQLHSLESFFQKLGACFPEKWDKQSQFLYERWLLCLILPWFRGFSLVNFIFMSCRTKSDLYPIAQSLTMTKVFLHSILTFSRRKISTSPF